MREEHEPSRKEVFGEVANGVKQYFSRDNLSNIAGNLRKTGSKFLGMTALFSIGPYFLPYVVRSFREADSSNVQLDVTDNVGFSTGIVGGLALDAAQVLGYMAAVQHDHPEALLIPVVTNVGSGFYELGRVMYNSARERILSRQRDEGTGIESQFDL